MRMPILPLIAVKSLGITPLRRRLLHWRITDAPFARIGAARGRELRSADGIARRRSAQSAGRRQLIQRLNRRTVEDLWQSLRDVSHASTSGRHVSLPFLPLS